MGVLGIKLQYSGRAASECSLPLSISETGSFYVALVHAELSDLPDCLPRAGIKHFCHHAQPKTTFFFFFRKKISFCKPGTQYVVQASLKFIVIPLHQPPRH